MKIYISNYRSGHWLSPYQTLEKVFFWRKGFDVYDQEPPKWLTITMQAIKKLLDAVHPRIEYVKIDDHDVWSMDHTLGLIILPMLKKLKESKHSSGFVDNSDVPERLKSFNAPRVENEWDTDEFFHDRWGYVLEEMIFAFESLNNDWEDQFQSGVSDWHFNKSDNGHSEMIEGPNHTREYDWLGYRAYEARIQNGFCLFGKYFRNLWA